MRSIAFFRSRTRTIAGEKRLDVSTVLNIQRRRYRAIVIPSVRARRFLFRVAS